MDFLTPLFGTLEQGFKLWNSKEGRKYQDEVITLKQEYSNELLKPYKDQSDLVIIRVQRRLLVLSEAFIRFGEESSNK